MSMKTHELKTWPEYFQAVWEGKKTFEIRKNDRGFYVEDTLVLREYEPRRQSFTGRRIHATVNYMTDWGQPIGQVVMGIETTWTEA